MKEKFTSSEQRYISRSILHMLNELTAYDARIDIWENGEKAIIYLDINYSRLDHLSVDHVAWLKENLQSITLLAGCRFTIYYDREQMYYTEFTIPQPAEYRGADEDPAAGGGGGEGTENAHPSANTTEKSKSADEDPVSLTGVILPPDSY